MNKTTERKLMEASLVLAFWLLVITLGALYRVNQLQTHLNNIVWGAK